MKKLSSFELLQNKEKNFLADVAEEIAMLTDKDTASEKRDYFQKQLTEFAEKWKAHRVAYKARSKNKWQPSMGKPSNPLGRIWPYIYWSERGDDLEYRESPGGGHSFPICCRDVRWILGAYALLAVIHDKVLPHCPSIVRDIFPKELTQEIWRNLVTGVDVEGSIGPERWAVWARKDIIQGFLNSVKKDIAEKFGLPEEPPIIKRLKKEANLASTQKNGGRASSGKAGDNEAKKMDRQKNTKSLLEIARSVSNLVIDPEKMKCFRKQAKAFYDEVVKYEGKEQTPDPVGRLVLPYANVSKAHIGLLIGDDKPKNLSIPYDKEKSLQADYVLLTIIHDKRLKNPRTPLISDGIWSKDEEWVELKWREISEGYACGNRGIQTQVELTLKRVETDLPKPPAERRLKTNGKAGKTKKPDDTITLLVAVKDYNVSRSTLKRAIKDGKLPSYRKPKAPKNSPHLISRKDIEQHYNKRLVE